MHIFFIIGNNKKYPPHILWLKIYKSQLGSEGKIDLFIWKSWIKN